MQLRVEQNVARLEVAVERPGIVNRGHALANFVEDLESLLEVVVDRLAPLHVERPWRVRFHPVLEGASLDQLHHEERDVLMFARRVDVQHVRVVHTRHRARLRSEALSKICGQQRRAHELDRDRAIEPLVARANHDAHGACADAPLETVEPFDQRSRREILLHVGQDARAAHRGCLGRTHGRRNGELVFGVPRLRRRNQRGLVVRHHGRFPLHDLTSSPSFAAQQRQALVASRLMLHGEPSEAAGLTDAKTRRLVFSWVGPTRLEQPRRH